MLWYDMGKNKKRFKYEIADLLNKDEDIKYFPY